MRNQDDLLLLTGEGFLRKAHEIESNEYQDPLEEIYFNTHSGSVGFGRQYGEYSYNGLPLFSAPSHLPGVLIIKVEDRIEVTDKSTLLTKKLTKKLLKRPPKKRKI